MSLNSTDVIFFLGVEMFPVTRQILIDLALGCLVIAIILLPSICCPVEGRSLRRKDSWDDIIKDYIEEKTKKRKDS